MTVGVGSKPKNLDRVFKPRSVAVVGDKAALGYMWLRSLRSFKGQVWSVQIDPSEFPGIAELGVPNYLSLLDIPDVVDYVIAAVPRAAAPRIVEDCVRKEVGGVCFFTSGFAETGTDEGIALQRIIADMAREAGLNLIGPNCVGVYNPEAGLRHAEGQEYGKSGSVGFIAQSGTHATLFSILAPRNGIGISKSISYGNAAVLDSTDFLEYLGEDEATQVVGIYIEGVRDGRRFLDCLRDVARRKPVFMWKGGETAAGVRATASHTGMLAESTAVWKALMKQCGAMRVENLEEMIDSIRALLHLKPLRGTSAGLIAMSGGQSVVITDTFAKAGMQVPLLSDQSYEQLAGFFNIIGGSYRNPLDISSSFFLSTDSVSNLRRMLAILDGDPCIDCVVLELFPVIRPLGTGSESEAPVLKTVFDFFHKTQKPFAVVVTDGHDQALASQTRERLAKGGIVCFASFERAAKTMKRLADHYVSRQELSQN